MEPHRVERFQLQEYVQGILLACCVAWVPGKRCCHESEKAVWPWPGVVYKLITLKSEGEWEKEGNGRERETETERRWELWNSFVGCSNPFARLLRLFKAPSTYFFQIVHCPGQVPNALFTHDPQSLLFRLGKGQFLPTSSLEMINKVNL